MKILKKIFLILLLTLSLTVSIFANTTSSASLPTKDTITKIYDNWESCLSAGEAITEDNSTYFFVTAKINKDSRITAIYQIPETITKTYDNWKDCLSAGEVFLENNRDYYLVKATLSNSDSKISALYQLQKASN